MIRTVVGVGLAICLGLARPALAAPLGGGSFMQEDPAPAAAEAQRAFEEGTRHMKAKRYAEAVAAFQRALKARPDFAEAHSNLGYSLRNTGKVDQAIAEYQEALRLKPDLAEAREYLGGAYLMKGDKQAALEQHRILERQNPKLAAELMEEIQKAR
jgi:Flp pilus assembly protein TadD